VISDGVLVTTAPGGDIVRLGSPAMPSSAPTSFLAVPPAEDHTLHVSPCSWRRSYMVSFMSGIWGWFLIPAFLWTPLAIPFAM